MATKSNRKDLPDLQNLRDNRGKAIERVGVGNVLIPLRIRRKDTEDRLPSTVEASVSMYVSIDDEIKGANMSRFIETLMSYESQILSSDSLEGMIEKMLKNLNSRDGYIKIAFKYFVERFAPVSSSRGVQGYDCAFIGTLKDGKYNFVLEVTVTGTTLCPCSKEISEYSAHNQRNITRVRIVPAKGFRWIEDVVALIEDQYSCPIYPLLKREDEKWVTEQAYEHPKFVEDISRDIAIALDKKNIQHYHIKTSAQESIHHHEAIAILRKNWILE